MGGGGGGESVVVHSSDIQCLLKTFSSRNEITGGMHIPCKMSGMGTRRNLVKKSEDIPLIPGSIHCKHLGISGYRLTFMWVGEEIYPESKEGNELS